MGRGRHYSGWRRRLESVEALFYGEGWAARLAHGLRLHGGLVAQREELAIPLSRPLDEPLRIAFASDLHAGPLTDPRLFATLFQAMADFSPHVVLLGGDYVSLHERHVEVLVPFLSALRPPFGILGVMGNHDLWVDDAHVARALRGAGVRVLVNEFVRLPAPFDEIVVCGLDEPGTGAPDVDATFREAWGARILLTHSPLGLRLTEGQRVEVAFCGHTHGGQIALPGGVPVVLPRGSGPRRQATGRYRLGGQEVIVSNGVGMSDLPIRLFAPSEVHLVCLSRVESLSGSS